MGERREGSKLSDLLTPTNILVGASALAVIGVGAAIIMRGRGGEDDDDSEEEEVVAKKKEKKPQKKAVTKQQVRSRYEEEEVEARPVAPAKKGGKAPAKAAAPEPAKFNFEEEEEEETPGAPIERKPAAKKAATAAAPATSASAKKPAASAAAQPVIGKDGTISKMSFEDAQKWLRTYPSHQSIDSLGAAFIALGDAMAKKQKSLTEDDIEGDLELTFDRWFLTGFIAGLVRKHKDAVLPILVEVLQVLPEEEADELDTPGIIFNGFIMSGYPSAVHMAFRLFVSQLPDETFKDVTEAEAQEKMSAQFDSFLVEFQDTIQSYMVLIYFGHFHAEGPDTVVLDKAMAALKEFYDATEDNEGKDELFKGTKFAFQRFGYYSPSGGQYLVQWAKRDGADEFSKNCIKDAFSAEPVAAQAD